MNKATYKVLTKSDMEIEYTFTECVNMDDYGNGIYIGVKRGNELLCSIDARYIHPYKFEDVCELYLKNYFGENLAKIGRVEFKVFMESGQGARCLLASFEDYDEALEFCQAHNYCYTDENGYVWDLDLVEINA